MTGQMSITTHIR